MSPTTVFSPAAVPAEQLTSHWPGGGVPGVWDTGWVAGRAIPGYYPPTLPDPNISLYLALGPTHGQMKAILEVSEIRVPE